MTDRTTDATGRDVSTRDRIEALLRSRILVMDGAMGTMVQRHTLDEAAFRGERFAAHAKDLRGNNDLLVLTQPDVITGIHHAYLEAGSDIIETNTFSSTAIAQADYGLESFAYELNVEAARLATQAAAVWSERTPERPRFVAGSIGPTNRTLSISPDVNDPTFRACTFDALRTAYAEQVRGLVDGGCDLLLVETIFDTLNAKAALVAIREVFDEGGIELPLMISVTITDRSGRTLSGQTIDAFYVAVAHAQPLSVGINCALGARDMRPYLAELSGIAECYVSSYPNAGLPNAFGEYDEQPDQTGALLKDFADSGFVNILGGCCGTTPDHISAVVRAVDGVAPRPLPSHSSGASRFSGLEVLTVRDDSNFLMVGERTNVTGSARFARLIKSDDFTTATDVAVDQVRGGANLIDVNMDEALLDSEQSMTHFLNLIATEPEVARVPVMIDSSKWSVIEAGLKCVQGKAVVNSISLKEGEADFLDKAQTLRRYGAAAVVMAFDETGQADTIERKVSICRRAYTLLTEQRWFRPARHHLRPEHSGHCDRARRAQRLRRQLHRGDRRDQTVLSRCAHQRRGQQSVVLVPRQQRRPRSDSLGVSVSRRQGRHGHGHRQCRPAGRVRGHRARTADPRRGHHLQPPSRRHRTDGRVCRDGQGRRRAPRGRSTWLGVRAPWPSGFRTRSCEASSITSSRTTSRRHALETGSTARRDRGPADGWHEDRGRPVRGRQDVSAASGQECPRHEEGCRLPRTVHGSGTTSRRRGAVVAGQGCDGNRQG